MANTQDTSKKLRDKRRALTCEFISDYLVDCRLRKVSGFDEEADQSTPGILQLPERNPFDGNLKEGQIRLLSQPSELTYVVLLRRWGDDAFVVTPFSHFSTPATDDELKTTFDGGLCLRVLQIWNTRTALDTTLKKSWLIGELPSDDMEDAWKVWEWSLGKAEPGESIIGRTGLPLTISSDDLRRQYVSENFAKFARFDAENRRHALFQNVGITLSAPSVSPCGIALAAAGKGVGSIDLYEIGDGDQFLQVEFSPASGEVVLSVLDASDGALSDKFDGCPLLEEENGALASFKGGVIRLRADAAKSWGKITILSKDDEPVTLAQREMH